MDLSDIRPSIFGVCEKQEDGSFDIWIDSFLDMRVQMHFLIHEYAHTLSGEFGEPHGPSWGVAHAAVYSYIFDSVPVVGKRRKRQTTVGGAK